MFDHSRLAEILAAYKQNFVSRLTGKEDEIFKWKAVKCFQDHWNVNVNGGDFARMLERSLSETNILLKYRDYFPASWIVEKAEQAPEEVRGMFIALFDENKDVFERIMAFKQRSSALLGKYGKGERSHFQAENVITTYLWLRYPDKYYIFQLTVVKEVAKRLEADTDGNFKKGAYTENLRHFLKLYNELNAALKEDTELVNLLESQLTDACYPDPELKTLTVDIGRFISKYNPKMDTVADTNAQRDGDDSDPSEADRGYWWLNADPDQWSFTGIDVGEMQSYTLRNDKGKKRRLFKNFLNAKVGDLVIGYESTPAKQIVAIAQVSAEQDGKRLFFEKVEGLASPIDYATVKSCPELKNMEFLRKQRGTLFKLTKKEFEIILNMIREKNPVKSETSSVEYKKNPTTSEASNDVYTKDDFLNDVYMSKERYDNLVAVLKNKKNIILQGPPGVGKTFAARRLAWSMIGKRDKNRVDFVQFHQNYSYEDFMMGYKPVEDRFELMYGVFYQFCQKAAKRPDEDFFFIIDEINRGNMSKIFGELLMLIEKDCRGEEITLAYTGLPFSVPENLYIIGMMNTADRSLAMIDYALRRRFSFFDLEPGFESKGFVQYQEELNSETLDNLILKIKALNEEIARDKSLGKGFCIGHSYFCGQKGCMDMEERLRSIVYYDIIPMLREYWFDEPSKLERWEKILQSAVQR